MEALHKKELLNEKETAELIGMSTSYLRKARMTGDLDESQSAPKFLKIGRAVRYRSEDIRDWLNSLTTHEHLLDAENSTGKVSSKKEQQNVSY